ncbi:hypothetical protein VTO42DRAFT_4478 [Malbranchea cinnamomea]
MLRPNTGVLPQLVKATRGGGAIAHCGPFRGNRITGPGTRSNPAISTSGHPKIHGKFMALMDEVLYYPGVNKAKHYC